VEPSNLCKMGGDARSRSREREKGRDRDDRGGGDGRLREDERGGLSRGPRGPAPERPGARGGGMYDARGPPDRGFDPRGDSRGLARYKELRGPCVCAPIPPCRARRG
jgi:hypothetical protein